MLPYKLISSLATAAAPPIDKVLASGGVRSAAPRGEVSAVRALTLDGFDEIAQAWSPILKAHGYRIDLRAVFCHSHPLVSFARIPSPYAPARPTSTGCCELADLLLVIDFVDPRSRQRDRRAVLIQAKRLKGNNLRPSGKEWIQHELLAWLPSFTFNDAVYDPRARDLSGNPTIGNPAFTAEYGGIELNPTQIGWSHWLPVRNTNKFEAVIDLASFLAGMAVGEGECARQAVAGGADDWSFTVDELLKVTAAKPIVKANPTVLRGNDNMVGFLMDTAPYLAIASGGGRDDFLEGDIPEWPEGPISTVKITLRSMDDPKMD